MILSFKILRFNYTINAFITYINTPAGIIRYGLTPLQVTAITDFLTTWDADMKPYVDPLQNGHVTIVTINTDYVTGYALMQSIRTQVKGNVTIVLTAAEKAIFNILPPGRSSSGTLPKFAPSLACIGQASQSIEIVALNPNLPFKEAKPDGADAIGYALAITKPGAPAPLRSAYVNQESETTTKSEIIFSSANVGDTAYIIAFYIKGTVQGHDSLPYVITVI